MSPRDVVAAVRGDDRHRLAFDRPRQWREEIERAVVRPLQVVEEHRDRTVGGRMDERQADGLEQHGAIAGVRRRAELREERGEMPA